MIIDSSNLDQWAHKGHVFGECMSHPDSDLMYVNIPKNASSWTKPNLLDWGWKAQNYHTDQLDKTAIVVLRDPVDRWLSGIAEYLALYHPNFGNGEWTEHVFDIIFDTITFDDHTEQQVKFLQGLDTDRCVFFRCDQLYRQDFSKFLNEQGMANRYHRYEYQHVSENDPVRHNFKELFKATIQNSKYLDNVKRHFAADYDLINSIKYYGSR